MFVLFNWLIVMVLLFVLPVLFGFLAVPLMYMDMNSETHSSSMLMIAPSFALGLYCLAALIPGLAVTVRRLHDAGKSGWLILLNLIPMIGGIVLLVFLCEDSRPETNEWGVSPKA